MERPATQVIQGVFNERMPEEANAMYCVVKKKIQTTTPSPSRSAAQQVNPRPPIALCKQLSMVVQRGSIKSTLHYPKRI